MAHRRSLVFVATAVAFALMVAIVGCSDSGSSDGRVRVVAGFYPLAWAAREIGGASVAVEDLTHPGAEAHDLQLTARQRASIQDAALVLLLGKGFQPELERAARDTSGRTVDLLGGLTLLQSDEEGLSADPHVWLDPILMGEIVAKVGEALAGVDRTAAEAYRQRTAALRQQLSSLDGSYRTALARCALRTLVTTHEAFGYLARRYGLTELGLTGLTPEAEPSAAQIRRVRDLARQRKVEAIFVEATDEGRRIGRSVARDVGVPALDLNTLESDPKSQDYFTQMRANLGNLRKGLRCS